MWIFGFHNICQVETGVSCSIVGPGWGSIPPDKVIVLL